jgi:amino acid adenylation domain-containing protein
VEELWTGTREALGRVRLPAQIRYEADAYFAHPALTDACLQVLAAAAGADTAAAADAAPWLPVGVSHFRLHASGIAAGWSHARIHDHVPGAPEITGDVTLLDDEGAVLAEFTGLRARRVPLTALSAHRQVSGSLYVTEWHKLPAATAPDAVGGPGRWIVFDDGHGLGAQIQRLLRDRGDACLLVRPAADTGGVTTDSDGCQLDEADPQACLEFFNICAGPATPPCRGLIYLGALREGQAAGFSGLYGAAHLLRAASQLEGGGRVGPIWLVTRGAQATTATQPVDPAQATLWGLGRAAAVEHPGIWGGLIDLPPEASAASAPGLLDAITAGDGEDQVALRDDGRFGLRLTRHAAAAPTPIRCDPSGVYLITGGLGGLGLHMASWLADHGARDLLLVGRNVPAVADPDSLPPGHPDRAKITAIDALRSRGVHVHVASADISDPQQAKALLAAVGERLRGVIHAAGVLKDVPLRQMDDADLRTVLDPKALGAAHLDAAAASKDVGLFVLFSSAVALLGSPGQANYAAANAYLDALAHDRRRRGLAALSVNWGPWAGSGMVAKEGYEPHLTAWGVHRLQPTVGLAALTELAQTGATQAAVLPIDWGELSQRFPGAAGRPFLSEVAAHPPAPTAAGQAGLGPAGLLATEPAQRQARLAGQLRARVAAAVRENAETIDNAEPITTYGVDSLIGVELRNGIAADFGVTLPMSTLIGGPTIDDLATSILGKIQPRPPAAPTRAATADTPDDLFPLSRGQEALWFIYRSQPDSASYNIVTALRLMADLDPQVFAAAWESLVRRHPMLRATFADTTDGPRARLGPAESVKLEIEDARGWTGEQLRRALITEAHRPFDLEKDAPLRLRLFTRSHGEHVFMLTVHHIVADLWSLVVLFSELGPAYRAAAASTPLDLPPAATSYANYARAQRELLSGAQGAALWAYWREQLKGVLPVLALPTDRPRPATQSYAGQTIGSRIDGPVLRGLKDIAAQHNTTLFTVLLAALFVMLHHETGQADIIIGSPTSGRDGPDLTGLVGYLVQPLPLRADLSGNPLFADFLRTLRHTVLDAFDHGSMPVVDMVERLNPVRAAAYSPLFQTMFALQRPHVPAFRDLAPFVVGAQTRPGERPPGAKLHEWAIEPVTIDRHVAMFDLTWMMAETHDGLVVSLEFNTDLFEQTTARRFLEHLESVLRGLVAGGCGVRVGDVPLLPAAERDLVIEKFNASAADLGADASERLEVLVARRAAGCPDRVAVVDGSRVLTYAGLMDWAGRVTARLRSAGIGRGDLVGIVADKGFEQVAGVLGVTGAGAAYLPVSADWPAERARQVLALGGVRCVLTQPWLRGQVTELVSALPGGDGVPVLVIDEDTLGGAEPADLATGAAGPPSDMAYVIFTSGSTGTPKGVMIDHRAAVNTILDINQRFGVGAGDRVLGVSALTFDLSVWDIFGPLSAGAALVLPDRNQAADPAHWADLAAIHRVTIWNSVPQLLGLLLDAGAGQPRQLSSLRLALLSGDWIPLDLPGRAQTAIPGVQVIGMGGATEAAIWSIAYPVAAVDPAWPSIPYGRPTANQRWYVLDRRLRPCPIGVTGELFIGGGGVALGYLGDPLRTAERFVADPFGAEGARIYRTGDMGRWRPDGTIEFLGRADGQVKIRGFRVEPGEIEGVLRRHAQVGQAVVTPWPAPGAGPARQHQRLVAYVVPAAGYAGQLADEEWSRELRSFVAGQLPDYMVPARFVVTGALPLSANGKVDKSALPAPAAERPGTALTAPCGQAEQTLAQIWSEVLDVGPVGREDNFFELGGDSILSIQIVSRAAKHGIVLKPAMIFQHQTIAELAAAAAQTTQQAATPLAPIAETSQETLDALIEELEEQED